MCTLPQVVNPPLVGVFLGLAVGLSPLGRLLFPPSTAATNNFGAAMPARCHPSTLSLHRSAGCTTFDSAKGPHHCSA